MVFFLFANFQLKFKIWKIPKFEHLEAGREISRSLFGTMPCWGDLDNCVFSQPVPTSQDIMLLWKNSVKLPIFDMTKFFTTENRILEFGLLEEPEEDFFY